MREHLLPALVAAVAEKGITDPCYCYDHARPYDAASDSVGIERGSAACCPIAPSSGDMNKPVEHAIHTLKAAFTRWLMEGGATNLTPARAQSKLEELFFSTVTQASVAADVETLRDTMRAIVTPKGQRFTASTGNPPKEYEGSYGDWAPRGLR